MAAKLTGRVIGHLVRHLPHQEAPLGNGIALVKKAKIGAFVQIQVDGKKFYTVRSEALEEPLNGREPTTELHCEVYNKLVEAHPFQAERTFIEHVSQKGKGRSSRRTELLE